jgi:predicted DNA-binding protein
MEINMISIRLDNDTEEKIKIISKNENISKSDVIKKALDLFFEHYNKKNSPYELGKVLFGKYGSGKNNSSKDYKKLLKGKLHEKYSR